MFLILLAARKDGTRPLKFISMEIEELIKIAESDSWTVTEEEYTNGKGLLFSKRSPAGQDFSISTGPFESAEELINNIHQRYVEYDADSEAYLWLDNEGHGKNGAPHRMRDVLEDMEACEKMIYDLFICYRDAYEKK